MARSRCRGALRRGIGRVRADLLRPRLVDGVEGEGGQAPGDGERDDDRRPEALFVPLGSAAPIEVTAVGIRITGEPLGWRADRCEDVEGASRFAQGNIP